MKRLDRSTGEWVEVPTAKSKLEDAIVWMRERNLYCLDKGSKEYKPVNGWYPAPIIKQPTRLDEDCSYGGLGYLRRFDNAAY